MTQIKIGRYLIKIRQQSSDIYYAMVILDQSSQLDDAQHVLMLRSYKTYQSALSRAKSFLAKQLKGI